MPEQQSPQVNPQMSNAVLQSQQTIVQNFADVVKQAQGDLAQAQAAGNDEDSIQSRQEALTQAQAQLAEAKKQAQLTQSQMPAAANTAADPLATAATEADKTFG